DTSLGMTNGSNPVLALAGTRVGPGPAAADKAVAALRLLAEHGANLNSVDKRGQRPLHAAALLGSNAMVRALVELGADPNATDGAGKTALDLVTQPGRNRHEDT